MGVVVVVVVVVVYVMQLVFANAVLVLCGPPGFGNFGQNFP